MAFQLVTDRIISELTKLKQEEEKFKSDLCIDDTLDFAKQSGVSDDHGKTARLITYYCCLLDLYNRPFDKKIHHMFTECNRKNN